MRKVLPFVSLNGKILPREKASVSVFDQGFFYSFGFFTTLKVREGVPLFWERHIKRLRESAQYLEFSPDSIPENLKKKVSEVISKNKIKEGGIRITVSAGNNEKPNVLIHALTIEKEIKKVEVITVEDQRDNLKTIKMTYRAPHLLARKKAQEQKAQDALFVQKNNLIESSYANIYSLSSEGEIITPQIEGKGLNGISRQILMENLPIKEREISLYTTDPLVLVSSLSIRAVESIDKRKIRHDADFVSTLKNAMEKAERKYIDENTDH